MSHQDVVPAEGEWSYPPFSGQIAEGKVWGRGTSDTKASLMAFFQAAEDLLAQDYIPACDVYLASSCTEEWSGDGAPKIVEELKRRGVEFSRLRRRRRHYNRADRRHQRQLRHGGCL